MREIDNGREARTVEIDPERGPLMAWGFDSYATGEWTIRKLLAELTRRGLTTGLSVAGKPLSVSHLHTLLRHPYYMGLVRYQGVLYPGKHEPLVTRETWQEVQELLSAKHLAGEKEREHPHYLKGSVYCGQCGSRSDRLPRQRPGRHLSVLHLYRPSARQDQLHAASLRIERAEETSPPTTPPSSFPRMRSPRLRAFLSDELSTLRTDAERERGVQERRLGKLGPSARSSWMPTTPGPCRSICSRASRIV